MPKKDAYLVLAYYLFAQIEDPHREIREHKAFFKNRDLASRIYISEQGINGQMSGIKEDAEAYMEWMQTRSPFEKMPFKIHTYHEQAFPRQTIKYRKQLVALDRDVDPAKGGKHISPKEWKEMLENKKNTILIDVRNDYESEIGHFEGAELPKCKTFREFNEYADSLTKSVDPKTTPVMMYCTGGIRCELYSTALKEKGFHEVYQLDGGVINYGLKEGNAHWLGKLFVFDDRMAVPISEEEHSVIGKCHFCKDPSDAQYNCANMRCNHLFISCPKCLHERAGCCKKECQEGNHVRPYNDQMNKPFRKWHRYFQAKN